MASLVLTPEMEENAKLLAAATGQTPTEAVLSALSAKLTSLHITPVVRRRPDMERIQQLLESMRGPIDYSLTEDEILGYDEDGFPEQPYLGR